MKNRRGRQRKRSNLRPLLLCCMVVLIGICAYFLVGGNDSPMTTKEEQAPLTIEEQAQQLVSRMSAEEKAGQLLMVGIHGTQADESVKKQLAACHAGNVILFDRNMESQEQVKTLTGEVRNYIAAQAGIAPFVALDQEGGQVLRMRDSFPDVPSEAFIGRSGNPDGAKNWARTTGKELKAMGINVNFAPVVDINSPAERSYGADADTVTQFALKACEGYAEAGVWCTIKHFPGIGKAKTDPHIDGDRVQASRSELEANDIKPFRDILQKVRHDNVFVMVSNVTFPALDETWPACVSKPIMTELLRKDLSYKGIIFSDDMEMGAMAKHYAFSEMGVMAIKAGADMILVCHDYGHERETYEGIVAAYKEDAAFRKLVDERVTRIIRIKLANKDKLA